LLVYPSAIDLSTSTLASAAGLTALVTTLGSGPAGGSGHHIGPPPLDTAAGLRELLNRTGLGMLVRCRRAPPGIEARPQGTCLGRCFWVPGDGIDRGVGLTRFPASRSTGHR
jgi:hypothetical protein